MALDDVVDAGKMYHSAMDIHRGYIDREGNLKSVPSNENLTRIVRGLLYNVPEDARNTAFQAWKANLGAIPNKVAANRSGGKARLITSTRDHYKQIINELPEGALLDIALAIPDSDKAFYGLLRKINDLQEEGIDIKEGLSKEDVQAIRTSYAKKFGNPAWEKFISDPNETSDDFIKENSNRYLKYATEEFKKGNLSREEERDGHKVFVPDAAKMKAYIIEKIASLSEPEKELAYFEIGKVYSLLRIAVAQQAAQAQGQAR